VGEVARAVQRAAKSGALSATGSQKQGATTGSRKGYLVGEGVGEENKKIEIKELVDRV